MSTGTEYVVEMLGRTLAERDQLIAHLQAEHQRAMEHIAELEARIESVDEIGI